MLDFPVLIVLLSVRKAINRILTFNHIMAANYENGMSHWFGAAWIKLQCLVPQLYQGTKVVTGFYIRIFFSCVCRVEVQCHQICDRLY